MPAMPGTLRYTSASAFLRLDIAMAAAVTSLWDNHEPRARALPEFAEFARRAGLARLWDTLGPPDLCSKNDKGDYACR